MKHNYIYITGFLFIFVLTSCSTVFNTSTQDVEIKSNPPNGKILIDGKKYGITPQIINLDRKSDHFVKIELEGYDTYETQITRKQSNWIWVNILNGMVPGLLVDMMTGSMYNLVPDSMTVNLQLTPEKPQKKK